LNDDWSVLPDMSYRDENGNYRKPKQLDKMPTRNAKIRPFWAKRSFTWNRKRIFFDQEIKTGICYFCKKEGRAQRSRTTVLHHLKYDNQDPLAWTLEVCTKCHMQIDVKNRKIIDRHFASTDFAKRVDREAHEAETARKIKEYVSLPLSEKMKRWRNGKIEL